MGLLSVAIWLPVAIGALLLAVGRDEHAGIVDALEGRNRIAFQYRMSQHLEAGLALFKEED